MTEERRRELAQRLELPEALLSRGDLADLGLPRSAIDRVFGRCDVVALTPRKPLVRVSDYDTGLAPLLTTAVAHSIGQRNRPGGVRCPGPWHQRAHHNPRSDREYG